MLLEKQVKSNRYVYEFEEQLQSITIKNAKYYIFN